MLPNRQYLFRLYHGLIYSGANDATLFPQAGIRFGKWPRELHYTDHIVSLPGTTVDLTDQVNTLVQAEATITVDTAIYIVAIFELSPDKPADEQTPVAIFHPFGDINLRPPNDASGEGDPHEPFDFILNATIEFYPELPWQLGLPFYSYNLCSRNPNGTYRYPLPDKFHVATIAREREIGRSKHQMIRSAVAGEDYFWSLHDTLVCRVDGSLIRLRFPLWQGIMSRLPYQHSGWGMKLNGQLDRQNIALSHRAVSGISTLHKQRKQLLRRNNSLSYIYEMWFDTVRILGKWFYVNDMIGWTTAGRWWQFTHSNDRYPFTKVNWQYLHDSAQHVVNFINTVGVATGNRRLIVDFPGGQFGDTGLHYEEIVENLKVNEPDLMQFAQKRTTKNANVLAAIITLLHAIMVEVQAYKAAIRAHMQLPVPVGAAARLQWAKIRQDIHTEFATKWPQMQRNFYGVFQLLFTWQLTFAPHENARGLSADDQLILRKRFDLTQSDLVGRRLVHPAPTHWPNLLDRDAWHLPQFVPYRLWDVTYIPDDYDWNMAAVEQAEREAAIEEEKELRRSLDREKELQRKIRRELAIATEFAIWDAENRTWDELYDNNIPILIDNFIRYHQVPMSAELREWAEYSVQRLRNLNIQLLSLRKKIAAAEAATNSDPTGDYEFRSPIHQVPQSIPYPTFSRWVQITVDGERVNVREDHTPDGVVITSHRMDEHDPSGEPDPVWPAFDPFYWNPING